MARDDFKNEADVFRLDDVIDFTFEDDGQDLTETEREKAAAELAAANEEIKALKEQNLEIMKRVTSFMNKLKGDKEKNTISWPAKDRIDGINKFLTGLNDLRKKKDSNE